MKKITRITSLALAVLMLCSLLTVGTFAASPFSDVKESRWSYSYIMSPYEDGIINGKGAGKFAPADNITRSEFVKILGGVEGINPDSYTTLQFTDVKYTKWYAGYVAWAVRAGITKGTSDTTFSPNAKISRQDMAVMIYRYATNKGITLPEVSEAIAFADDAKISGYAKAAVTAMQKASILSGEKNKDGTYNFNPKNTATREQASKILAILYSMTPKDDRGAAFDALKTWLDTNATQDTVLYGDYYNCYSKVVETGTSANNNPYEGIFEIFYDHDYNEIVISIVYVEDMGDYDYIISTMRSITKAYGPSFFSTTVRTTAEAGYLFWSAGEDMSHMYALKGYLPEFVDTDGSEEYLNKIDALEEVTASYTQFAAEYTEELIFDKYIPGYSLNDLGFCI